MRTVDLRYRQIYTTIIKGRSRKRALQNHLPYGWSYDPDDGADRPYDVHTHIVFAIARSIGPLLSEIIEHGLKHPSARVVSLIDGHTTLMMVQIDSLGTITYSLHHPQVDTTIIKGRLTLPIPDGRRLGVRGGPYQPLRYHYL